MIVQRVLLPKELFLHQVLFEGKGWYETDFKTGSKKKLVQLVILSQKKEQENKSAKQKQEKPKT